MLLSLWLSLWSMVSTRMAWSHDFSISGNPILICGYIGGEALRVWVGGGDVMQSAMLLVSLEKLILKAWIEFLRKHVLTQVDLQNRFKVKISRKIFSSFYIYVAEASSIWIEMECCWKICWNWLVCTSLQVLWLYRKCWMKDLDRNYILKKLGVIWSIFGKSGCKGNKSKEKRHFI